MDGRKIHCPEIEMHDLVFEITSISISNKFAARAQGVEARVGKSATLLLKFHCQLISKIPLLRIVWCSF
jgi:hypothetical protein